MTLARFEKIGIGPLNNRAESGALAEGTIYETALGAFLAASSRKLRPIDADTKGFALTTAANTFMPAQTFNGGAKLGESGVAVKQKLITGTAPAAGASTGFSLGIPSASNCFVQLHISNVNGANIPPGSLVADRAYGYYVTSSKILTLEIPAAATSVAGRAFAALVTYTA